MDSIVGRKVRVELEGDPRDGGAVRALDLAQFLQQFLTTLAAVEKEITGAERAWTVYRVAALSYASPVLIELEAGAPERPAVPDVGPAVVSRFTREVAEVSAGAEPAEIGFETLEALLGLTAGYRRHIQEITIESSGTVVPIPKDFDTKVRRLLGNVYRTHGTFRGRLEAVNLHTNPSTVHIYPPAGPGKIRCTYRKGAITNIGELLERDVEVRGVLKFRGDAPHPLEIEVETITPLAPAGRLPTVAEIAGTMPGLGGDLDSVKFIGTLRDGEEDP